MMLYLRYEFLFSVTQTRNVNVMVLKSRTPPLYDYWASPVYERQKHLLQVGDHKDVR